MNVDQKNEIEFSEDQLKDSLTIFAKHLGKVGSIYNIAILNRAIKDEFKAKSPLAQQLTHFVIKEFSDESLQPIVEIVRNARHTTDLLIAKKDCGNEINTAMDMVIQDQIVATNGKAFFPQTDEEYTRKISTLANKISSLIRTLPFGEEFKKFTALMDKEDQRTVVTASLLSVLRDILMSLVFTDEEVEENKSMYLLGSYIYLLQIIFQSIVTSVLHQTKDFWQMHFKLRSMARYKFTFPKISGDPNHQLFLKHLQKNEKDYFPLIDTYLPYGFMELEQLKTQKEILDLLKSASISQVVTEQKYLVPGQIVLVEQYAEERILAIMSDTRLQTQSIGVHSIELPSTLEHCYPAYNGERDGVSLCRTSGLFLSGGSFSASYHSRFFPINSIIHSGHTEDGSEVSDDDLQRKFHTVIHKKFTRISTLFPGLATVTHLMRYLWIIEEEGKFKFICHKEDEDKITGTIEATPLVKQGIPSVMFKQLLNLPALSEDAEVTIEYRACECEKPEAKTAAVPVPTTVSDENNGQDCVQKRIRSLIGKVLPYSTFLKILREFSISENRSEGKGSHYKLEKVDGSGASVPISKNCREHGIIPYVLFTILQNLHIDLEEFLRCTKEYI